ncbi:MAG: Protein-export membrane protein secD, accessory membrane protein [Candidatus Moranbacteria bacterium GW2011_GWC1_45_18]|nr:MAG: Protein translocase subunit SecD [Candidatus Moranbacteria bacterium GW2011_GWC2_40_12]KKT32810.1 MAG: Protein translocase subunit SecD [Candidatus Moranbacteria bacterium GW2011_GWF2_44_10]KKT99859.1 MAG: Protein-export membrane protein secD, accessory membrane protein [Candidatus Moranbacteria bacterium GW2011_GWC1_45_18]OGI34414.1 MAG: protein-export membrane protein SecD [Candidatus Moranbacteria bacterium RIFOXYC1_FULL_44_8]OGI43418.1 MAG: protein-export membrane protein SecD [Cand
MSIRRKIWVKFFLVALLFAVAALIASPKPISKPAWLGNFLAKMKINLGLDLQGGIHLIYKVDTSAVDSEKIPDALTGLQDVIERRVNAFGVAEPLIETSKSGGEQRLIVELAGVKDIEKAKEMIKETPFLEFKKMEAPPEQPPQEISAEDKKYNEDQKKKAEDLLAQTKGGADFAELAKQNSEDPGSKDQGGDLGFVKKGTFVPEFDKVLFDSDLPPGQIYPQIVESQFGYHIIKLLEVKGDGEAKEVQAQHILLAIKTPPPVQQQPIFVDTGLTGKNLKRSDVQFMSQTGKPEVGIEFDSEGAKIFAQLTKENIGKQIAIFLDGQVISAPTVQSEISDGKAVITGDFTLEECKKLAQRLNEGALPLPITLIGQQSVEASLGKVSLEKSLKAGAIGIVVVMIFMIFYYRFLGLVASAALVLYTSIMVALFKMSTGTPWSITLTLAGIAGFILSVGMAVDANILIFERTKEEIRKGRSLKGAIDEGFHRAWPSIRDSNISSIITSLILIWFGTGFVKGFAVTLLLGVLVSMFTAIILVRTILTAVVGDWAEERKSWIIADKKILEKEEF